jgi:hypothetical protein
MKPLQSKKSFNSISFRRTSSGGSISSTQSEYFNRRTTKNDFEKIYLQWSSACETDGYMLPKNAIAELKKRITQSSTPTNGRLGGEKAKLNLSYASLDDKRFISLIEVLAQKPVIAKLDLKGNDFTDEVSLFLSFFGFCFSYAPNQYLIPLPRVLKFLLNC